MKIGQKNVVEYLVSKGVDSSSLIGIGYGETKLFNNCNNGPTVKNNNI